MDLRTVTVEAFAPLVGTAFSTVDGAELNLIEAKVLPQPPHIPGGRPPFRLGFTGAPPLLPQGIYSLTHAASTLETPLDIFLVPIAGNANGFTYEAIFN
jgi:hypothetical protein